MLETAKPFLRRHRQWMALITITLWATACVLTHLPSNDLPEFHAGDTSLHTFGFLGLASWFVLSLVAYDVKRLQRILIVLVVMMFYAALDERTQPFFGRGCELRDWVNDMVGSIAALVLWESIFLFKRRKPS